MRCTDTGYELSHLLGPLCYVSQPNADRQPAIRTCLAWASSAAQFIALAFNIDNVATSVLSRLPTLPGPTAALAVITTLIHRIGLAQRLPADCESDADVLMQISHIFGTRQEILRAPVPELSHHLDKLSPGTAFQKDLTSKSRLHSPVEQPLHR